MGDIIRQQRNWNWIDIVLNVLSVSCSSQIQCHRIEMSPPQPNFNGAKLDRNPSKSIHRNGPEILPAQPTFSTDSRLFLLSLFSLLSFLFLSSSASLLLFPSPSSISSTSLLSQGWGSLADSMSSNFTFLSQEPLLELELEVDPSPSRSLRSSSQRPTPESEQMKTSHIVRSRTLSLFMPSLTSQCCSKTQLTKYSFLGSNYSQLGGNWVVHPWKGVTKYSAPRVPDTPSLLTTFSSDHSWTHISPS